MLWSGGIVRGALSALRRARCQEWWGVDAGVSQYPVNFFVPGRGAGSGPGRLLVAAHARASGPHCAPRACGTFMQQLLPMFVRELRLPCWLHSPQPRTGWRKINWLLLANLMFLLGASLWLAAPLLCWYGSYDMCGSVGTAASSCYLVDALLYLADWALLRRSGADSVYGRQELLHTSVTQRIDYYLVGCAAFLLGVIADLVTSHFGAREPYVPAYEFAWYLAAMVLWMLYASMEIARGNRDRLNREQLNATTRFFLFPCGERKRLQHVPGVVYIGFAWDLCGSVLFWLASAVYLASANFWYFLRIDDCPECYIFEMVGAALFIINALCCIMHQGTRGPSPSARAPLPPHRFTPSAVVLRRLKSGRLFFVDSDPETTFNFEATRDQEVLAGDVDAEGTGETTSLLSPALPRNE